MGLNKSIVILLSPFFHIEAITSFCQSSSPFLSLHAAVNTFVSHRTAFPSMKLCGTKSSRTSFSSAFASSSALSFSARPQWAGIHDRTGSVFGDSIWMLSFILLTMLSCLGHGIARRTDFESVKAVFKKLVRLDYLVSVWLEEDHGWLLLGMHLIAFSF